MPERRVNVCSGDRCESWDVQNKTNKAGHETNWIVAGARARAAVIVAVAVAVAVAVVEVEEAEEAEEAASA